MPMFCSHNATEVITSSSTCERIKLSPSANGVCAVGLARERNQQSSCDLNNRMWLNNIEKQVCIHFLNEKKKQKYMLKPKIFL